MRTMAVPRGRRERSGEAYSVSYVKAAARRENNAGGRFQHPASETCEKRGTGWRFHRREYACHARLACLAHTSRATKTVAAS